MATQVFLTNANGSASTPYNFHSGRADALVGGGTTIFNQPKQASTSRGSGVVSSAARATVAGPTAGLDYSAATGDPFQWVTPPIDADVTISGTVTFNIWGLESSMNANCGPQVLIQRIDSTGATTTIVNSEEGAEWGTSASAHNWTASPTSTACLKGDRLKIVVGFNDVGTMAAGHTSTLRFSGTTGGADGDTYVSFTETFGFLTTDPTTTTIYPTDTAVSALISDTGWLSPASAGQLGGSWPWSNETNVFALDEAFATNTVTNAGEATNRHISQQFGVSLPAGSLVLGIAVRVWITSSENATLSVQLRNTGSAVGSVATTSVTFGVNQYYELGGYTHDWGTVFTESNIENSTSGFHFWLSSTSAGAEYSVDHTQIKVFYGPPATGRPREAWTSRGAGVQTDVTTSNSGPIDPKWMTDVAAGQNVDWFTKPLSAFTLSAPVLVNVRVKQQTSDFGNYAPRCEIAVCDGDGDGSDAVVWGSNQHAQEITTTETAYVFYISGDDVAVTDGQRLRIRFYIDDAWGTMVGGSPCTLYYAGTSGGASGDTFLTLGQTLTEYAVSFDPSLYGGTWIEGIDLQIAE